MQIIYSTEFKKTFKKQNKKIQLKYFEKIELFKIFQFDVLLNNHALNGEYSDYRSINITGDVRARFKIVDNIAIFVHIGSHSESYK